MGLMVTRIIHKLTVLISLQLYLLSPMHLQVWGSANRVTFKGSFKRLGLKVYRGLWRAFNGSFTVSSSVFL